MMFSQDNAMPSSSMTFDMMPGSSWLPQNESAVWFGPQKLDGVASSTQCMSQELFFPHDHASQLNCMVLALGDFD